MREFRSVFDISRSTLKIESLPLRALTCLIFALLVSSMNVLPGREIVAIDGALLELSERLRAPKTLVLVARSETQLRESFRLLTLAESKRLPTLILVELPADRPVQSIAIKRAARNFIKSDYGRRHIYFMQETATQDPSFTDMQSLLLTSDEQRLWRSSAYPTDGDFDTEIFQP